MLLGREVEKGVIFHLQACTIQAKIMIVIAVTRLIIAPCVEPWTNGEDSRRTGKTLWNRQKPRKSISHHCVRKSWYPVYRLQEEPRRPCLGFGVAEGLTENEKVITNQFFKIRTHLDLLSIPSLGGKNVKTFRWDLLYTLTS